MALQDATPNAKITDEQYGLLKKEFGESHEITKSQIDEDNKENNEEYKFDEDALNKVSSIVKNICKKELLDFKNILIENENKSNKYFEQNKYLKEGFEKINNFIFSLFKYK